MVAVRVSPFGGMVPAVDDRLLPDANSALSQDTWLYSGTAIGLPTPKNIHTLTNTNAAKVYRIPNNYRDATHFSDSIWMEFASADTDVIRTAVVGDTYDRYYWVSPLDVPRYFPLANIVISAPALTGAYKLGVPAPLGTLIAVPSGGASATLKSVAYVQTFVSAYGEEGPPTSPVSLTGVKIDATVTITLRAADPNDLGVNRNLTKLRIYRTVTSTAGVASYFFVAEMPIATASYADSATDAVVALNASLLSTDWSGPPSDLQGMVSLANGMVVAFRANELWFCEPFRMHAWPAKYTLVTEYPIIGLGVSNQTLVVTTSGFAYTGTGLNPGSFSLSKLPGLLPCTSRGSIVSTVDGVYFSAPAGLVLVSPRGVTIATKNLINKDKWLNLVATSTLRAAQLGDAYFAFGQARFGVFEVTAFDTASFAQQDFSGATRGVLIDVNNASVAFNLMASSLPVVNIQADAWSTELYIIRGGQVLWLDIGDTTQVKNSFIWRSKIYEPARKHNFQAAKIYFRVPTNTPTQNSVVTVGSPQTLQSGQYGLFRVYADGNLVMTREIRTSGEQWRLPSGFKADFWQFEIESRVEILNLQVATSATELSGI